MYVLHVVTFYQVLTIHTLAVIPCKLCIIQLGCCDVALKVIEQLNSNTLNKGRDEKKTEIIDLSTYY